MLVDYLDYLTLKYIHIISATILFGTGIGSAFYMFMANLRGDIQGINFAVRHVVIADWIFTTPAVIIQFITGVWMAYLLDISLTEGWLFWALMLYVFVGFCWLPVVWLQIKMRDMVKIALENNSDLPSKYWIMNKWWVFLGSLAFPAVIVIFYLMVFKPNIYGVWSFNLSVR